MVVPISLRAVPSLGGQPELVRVFSAGVSYPRWINGGETKLENLSLLCTVHHRLLHEGGFKIEREGDGELRFLRADGRAIPRGGYRLEDFTDDGCTADEAVDDPDRNPPREGFCTATVHTHENGVREPAAVYRVQPLRRRATT